MSSSPSELRRVLVLGAGQMGSGIAQVFATAGIEVRLYDPAAQARERALRRIAKGVERLAAKGRLDEEPRTVQARVTPLAELTDLEGVEFVLEAVVEDEQVKVDLFAALDRELPAEVIFATNTSSISVTRMGRRSGRPDRFVGMHFMNPAPLMQLVEVVVGLGTAPATVEFVEALAARLGKTTVRSEDYPGFIVNRILLPMINEAIYALQDGVGTPEDIDKAMLLGTNQPMGPLALADLIGLDVCLSILEVMHRTFGEDKYRPAPLLRLYVDAGWLGRKVGRGFYTYEE